MGVRQTPDVSPGRDRRIRWRLRCAGIGVLASVLVVPGVAVTVAMADSPTRVIETTSGPVRGLEHFSIRLGVARVCEISFAFVFGNLFEKRGDCSPKFLNSSRLHFA